MAQDTIPYTQGNILMIVFAQGEVDDNTPNWRIQIENDPNIYPFMGENADEQEQRINQLGQLMTEFDDDPDALYDQIGVLVDYPADITSAQIVDLFFRDTTALQFRGEIIYEVPPEAAALIERMFDAGTELLEALVL